MSTNEDSMFIASRFRSALAVLLLAPLLPAADAGKIAMESLSGEGCWVDPPLERIQLNEIRVTAWSDRQFPPPGSSRP